MHRKRPIVRQRMHKTDLHPRDARIILNPILSDAGKDYKYHDNHMGNRNEKPL